MSGAAFEGIEGAVEPGSATERYESGSFGYDLSLVSTLMEHYSGEAGGRLDRCYWRFPLRFPLRFSNDEKLAKLYVSEVKAVSNLIRGGAEDSFDANSFLDAMLGRMGCEFLPGESNPRPGVMLDSLVQALYDLGHNDFRIDLRRFQEGRQELPMLARNLRGSEERPLMATYYGDAAIFGSQSEHCAFEFHGATTAGANGAKHTSFTYRGKVGHLGGHPFDCVFHLDTIDPVVHSDDAMCNQFHVHLSGWTWYNSLLKKHALDVRIAKLRKEGFFNCSNIISLHRDGETEEVM